MSHRFLMAWLVAAVLGALYGCSLNRCVVRVIDGRFVEICERRECRDMRSNKFIVCPERP